MNIILIIILLVIILVLVWALLGGRTGISEEREDDSREEQATFRRRATDKEIEKEFPDETQAGPRRRKSDQPAETAPATEEPERPFQLPYSADEIIPETSRFRIYRRTLLNSEIYGSKGDYATAISLYEGVKSRIQDVDTRFKIDANTEYLKQFKKKREDDAKRRGEKARRGVAGDAQSPGGEIKIMLGGSLPDSINIDTLPDTINIGLIDPSRNLNMDALVENVTQKVRGELADVREELGRLRGMPAVDAAAAQAKLVEALVGVKAGLDRIEEARGPLRAEELAAVQAAGGAAMAAGGTAVTGGVSAEASAIREAAGSLADLKGEFRDLAGAVREMTAARIAEADREPALAAARLDSRPSAGGRVPRREAPAPSRIPVPSGAATEERIMRKHSEADEGDEFELLSEYGRETSGDELSDEEIFEKILRDDGKGKGKDDFEIIGEKKDRQDEAVTTTDEMEFHRIEDESFYRKLLSTTRRKKKELPILKVSYDFSKLPDELGLSREKNIIEYAFYKYKPMLERANDYIKKRKVRDAINYYKVVMSQNIPPEFKAMIRKNLDDLTEYLEKYLAGD